MGGGGGLREVEWGGGGGGYSGVMREIQSVKSQITLQHCWNIVGDREMPCIDSLYCNSMHIHT